MKFSRNYFQKTVAYLLFLLLSHYSFAQTNVFPVADGAFETGTTFAANGWTTANGGSTARVWQVGTGQPGYNGARSAFIGSSATTITGTQARLVHFYRPITIPAGATNIQLSFTYKQAVSDYSAPTYYDYIAAYTDGTTPTSGTLPPVGSRVFGPYPNNNIGTYTAQNVTLSNALAGTTTNLIFTFECDNQNPHGYGGIDDITLTYTPAPMPTITSFGAASGCVGSSITINGTGLTGATAANVKIGGTAVTSITSNTGTQIVAVIGTGTTGTMEVTTPGGTVTSAATFTVNPLPANPGNPTSNSPQCATPGVTLTRAGTPPAGVTWYWQTTAIGTSTASSGNTYNVTTSGTYYIRAQNDATGCWSSGAGSATVTVNNIPAITTNPTNSSIAVGTNTSFTVVASNTPTSYVWEVSTDGGGSWSTVTNGGVYGGATTATLTITAAPIGMDGYQYRARATNICGSSANSTAATLNVTLVYCTPSFTTSVEPISNVTFNTINNNSANTCGAGTSYENFTAVSTNAFREFSYTLSVTSNTCGSWTDYVYAYFDWNRDGDFADAGESYNLGTINTTTAGILTQSIAIPMGASLGSTRMRIIKNFASAPTDPCRTGAGYGQAEDYTINIIAPPACIAPTAQPTAISLTPAGTSISGSFTAAAPASDSYLVVISTSATPPSAPVNGTTYAIGSSLASGYIVVDNDSNTTFTATGLNISTTYYFYVFSFNGLCTGGPSYNTSSPLTGNATTTAALPAYCAPSSTNTSVYISKIRSVGTINDVTNGPTGYSATGYGNYSATTIATQVAGSGINLEIIVTGSYGTGGPPCPSTSQFIKTWVDWNKDGDFDDAGEQVYVSGTDAAPVATALDNIYGFVVPSGTFPGNYRMRVRTRAYCDSATLLPCATGYTTGETEDYTIAIVEDCPSKITSVTGGSACGPTNTVTLNATKTASATGFKWYTTLTGGAPIATTAAGTWTTPSIGVTTTYYVTAYDGVCETIHRTPVVATILPTSNITVTPSVPEVCGENNVVQISATGDFVTETLLLQTFESGMAPFTVNTPTNTNGGADSPWSVKTSPYVPNSTTVWRPALNSGAIGTLGNNFAFSTSDYSNSTLETIMTSPSIDASLFTSLTLTYNHIYGAFSGDTGRLEVSVAGGPFTAVERTYTTTDIGTPSVFATETVNFNAYAGQSNLRFRFRYNAQWDDGWAIDNIKLEGVKPLNTTFTWTGGTVNAFIDAGLTTPYVAQSVSTVYVVPTAAQLAAPSWSFTANATLGNGCPVSKLITIDNKTKLWVGSASNDWQNPNNWSPVGVPDANTCVIIYDGPFDSNVLSAVPAFAKTLIVRPNGDLQIHPNNTVTVTDAVTVDGGGIFNIRNTGSLVQINNVANSGIINMERISQPMYLLDYTYWNSPVTAASGFTLGNLTTATSYIFNYTPTQAGANGIWTRQSAGTVMSPTRGYIARAPLSFPTSGAKQTQTVNFIGTPNNGNISMPISKGTNGNLGSTIPSGGSTVVTDADDEWNLIGNPYPSAIDIVSFLTNPTNVPVVDGTVYLWTHNNPPTAATPDPFYGNYVLNYTVNDYATVNEFGTVTTAGGTTPSRYIGAGQSFFISADNVMANGTTANVLFNNSMRVTNENNHFLRTENEAQTPQGYEAKRLWLNLSNNAGGFSQILVGYATQASLGWDRGFDAESLAGNAVKFYSLAEDKKLTIQARPWPFVEEDVVPLGFKATSLNNYTIGIDHLDTDFISQNVYLEDKLLNIIHDLKSAPYSFTSDAGTFDSRFALRYTQSTLTNEDVSAFENTVTIFTNSKLNVKSTIEPIKEITVYDLLGRVLTNVTKVQTNEFTVSNLAPTESTLIVKVTLENNVVITKKVIY